MVADSILSSTRIFCLVFTLRTLYDCLCIGTDHVLTSRPRPGYQGWLASGEGETEIVASFGDWHLGEWKGSQSSGQGFPITEYNLIE